MIKKLLAITMIFFASASFAKDTLKIVVPYAPGGNTDVTARMYAKEITKQNVDVVIINRPGAEGKVGQNEFINNSKKEPNTLLFTGSGSIIYNVVENEEDYVMMKQLVPVIQASNLGQILVNKKDSPYKTYAQLMEASKHKQINIGTNSGATRLFAEDLFAGNKNIVMIPYNGDTPTMIGVMSNTVDAAFVTFVVGNKVVNNELNGLAVTTESGNFGIKSFKELGVNKNLTMWNGFFAPPGTPNNERDKWFDLIRKVKQDTEFREAIQTQVNSLMAPTRPPEQFSNFIETEYRKHKR